MRSRFPGLPITTSLSPWSCRRREGAAGSVHKNVEMGFLFTLILNFLVYILHVQCERHHLLYFYTALTKPDGFSGPVFIAVGVCNDKRISRYSNEEQTWKRDRFDAEIWRNTKEPHDSRDWFLHLVNTLANCDGLHTLQRRVGCEVEKHPDGSVMNVSAFDEYGYDGEDFIVFNYYTMQWMEKSPKAKETKMKWNNQHRRRQILKMDLKNCMNCISTFNDSIRTPPALHMFTSAAPRDQSKLILTCLATGFYPKHIEMKITLNNITLQPFSSTGVRPSDNQTFQMRTSVKIDEKQGYECRVLHSGQTFTTSWDGSLESRRHDLATVAVCAFVFAVVVLIMFVIYRSLNGLMSCNGSARSENVTSWSEDPLTARDSRESSE